MKISLLGFGPTTSRTPCFKSKYIKNVDVPSFKINGETFQEVDGVKYLGHYISNTLRDDKDILRQCRQLYARVNLMDLVICAVSSILITK